MSSENVHYQREGIQMPFVTQQPSWSEASAFATHGHPHQPVQYGPHHMALAHDQNTRPPVSSVDFAWSGYRPTPQDQPMHTVQGHNPFCHQHGRPEGEPTMHGHACGCPQHQHNTAVPPTVPTPPPSDGSPHPGWASGLAPSDPDNYHVAKRMKFDWSFDANNAILRPDGVRKKNAKFEIPEERNLDTLDTLIKHANSETELKELKMQKRLLRNREAALHSRQKKKSHTEWLEHERDSLMARLFNVQNELTNLHIRVDDHQRDKASWQEQLTQSEQKIANMQREKAMLLDQHARETSKLGMEIDRLREQFHCQRQSPTASPTSSANTATFSSDDSVQFSSNSSFGTNEWDGGYEFIEGCLDPGKLGQRPDATAPDILAH